MTIPYPDKGVLYNKAGALGSASNVSIADDRDLAFGVDYAHSGDVRLPRGSYGSSVWSVKKRNLGATVDLGLFDLFVDPDIGEHWVMGADPFSEDFHASAFDGGNTFVRTYLAWLLTQPETVIAGDAQGVILHQVAPESSAVAFYLAQRTNFAIAGARQYPSLADYGGGASVFYFGPATTRPVTDPTMGAIVYVDPTDARVYSRSASGKIDAMRAQPSPLLWGNRQPLGDAETCGFLTPGFAATAPDTVAIAIGVPCDGELESLTVVHNVPGPAPEDILYTVERNGTATALSAVVSADSSGGQDFEHAVQVARGDRVTVKIDKGVDVIAPSAVTVTLAIRPSIPT